MINFFHELIHNLVIHPILPFLPRKIANRLHGWHAQFAFGGENNLN